MESVKTGSLLFVRYYWITMRPYLLFVSGITGLTGISFCGTISPLKLTVLFLVFFFSYGFGQALTDCFQIDTDTLSSPYRPLTRGYIRRRDVLIVSLTGLLLSGLILARASLITLPFSLLAVIGLATYTFFKKRWWAGPFYNAWIVALLCLIAYTAAQGRWSGSVICGKPFLFTLSAVFFAYANFVLSGYFKDIEADRKTGYNTLPVVYGRRISAWISDGFALVSITATGIVLYLGLNKNGHLVVEVAPMIFALLGMVFSVVAQVRLHRVKTDAQAHRAIEPVVHTFLLQMLAITAVQKPSWVAGLICFYLGFVLTMKFRPMKEQI